MRRFLPVLAALAAAGCGYEGQPLPPLANIPARVADLTAVQRGSRILAQFTLPTLTTESIAIRSPLQFDVRIGESEAPFHAEDWAAHARRVTGARVSAGIAKMEISSGEWTGKQVLVAVRTMGSNGKPSGWSNFVAVPVVAPPPSPAYVRAQAVPTGVSVTWKAPGNLFRVFRRTGNAEPEAVATVEQPSWIDTATQYGQHYSYQVETITRLDQNREAQSELSEAAEITPEDRFPPATPTGFRAVASPRSVELSWDANTEPDLAGYRVYRSLPGGSPEKIADVAVPAYSDHNVEAGKMYRYEVSAIDRLNNESPHSAPAEVVLQ